MAKEEVECFDIIPDDAIGLIATPPFLELKEVFRFAATNKRIYGVIGKTFSTFVSSGEALTFSQVGQQFTRCQIIDALVTQHRLPPSELSNFFTSLDLKKPPILTVAATTALIGGILGIAANWYGADIESLMEAMKDGGIACEMVLLTVLFILSVSRLIRHKSDPINLNLQEIKDLAGALYHTALFMGMIGACMGGFTYLASTNFLSASIAGVIFAGIVLSPFFTKNELIQRISSGFNSILGNICGGFAGLLTGAAYSLVSGNYSINISSGLLYGASVGGAIAVGINLFYSVPGYAAQQFFKQRIANKEQTTSQLLAEKEKILPVVKK